MKDHETSALVNQVTQEGVLNLLNREAYAQINGAPISITRFQSAVIAALAYLVKNTPELPNDAP